MIRWPPLNLHCPFRTIALCASVLAAALSVETARAGEQAQRAAAAARQLVASGEVPAHTVLRLGLKQGNINAFLGQGLELQREWERETGIVLDARLIPQRPTRETLQGAHRLDLVVARNHEYPDLLADDLITDLTRLFAEFGFHLDDNPLDGFIRPQLQARMGERIVAIPADGDVAVLYLRQDLLEDPAEQAAFRTAFGRALALPETWSEYADLVRFFHRPEQGLYGAAEERGADTAWMYWLPRYLSQDAPYRSLFDADMRPLVDSPAGIAATESYVAPVAYSPPQITDAGVDYNYTLPLFAQGNAFATISTIAAARTFNAAAAYVRGRFVVAPLPGTQAENRVVRANTLIYGNNLVIPKGGQAKLAFLYAMWLTDPDISARSVGVPGGFTDPYRWNHLRDARIRDVYSDQALEAFAAAWPTAQPPGTGLPGDAEYLAALNRELIAAARGEQSPADAMARTAAAWEAITERHGRAEQVRHLRERHAVAVTSR